MKVPSSIILDGIEAKWAEIWQQRGTYAFAFDSQTPRTEVFSIDTPPPTVSGSLHIGHVFSYTHTDIIARYRRMKGYRVFYPMGWDDNGLPTERRVQNYFGVRCDPNLPYTSDYQPPYSGNAPKDLSDRQYQAISRANFVELCSQLSLEDERQFEQLWRTLGLSVDWNQTYRTIGPRAWEISQRAFLLNYQSGQIYSQFAPGLWDVTFQTAVAHAEVEAREYPGFYYRLKFIAKSQNRTVLIDTTRPELLAACVAVIVNPEDTRYQDLIGQTLITPLYGVEVPVLADAKAEIDKGTGVVMNCTFGDLVDVEWWRQFHLPNRTIINRQGRIDLAKADWINSKSGQLNFAALVDQTIQQARKTVIDQLNANGELEGDSRPTLRMTSFFEKGNRPLEIVSSRQWYIRNGGTDPELKSALLERGRQLSFYPEFMRGRYDNWVQGLNSDWLVSRQRFFGVPIPLWYPIDNQGQIDYQHPLTAEFDTLPIDPSTTPPPGYTEAQRGQVGGFAADPDVMDTWATSSLTPQIAGLWGINPQLFRQVYPMNLRPQGQDIIRTWLFSTMVRSHTLENTLPWQTAAISGFILDPDRKKMSKSKGNAQTPLEFLQRYSSDGVRYWAGLAKLGQDATLDEAVMKVGRRLAIKILNASKFVLENAYIESATPQSADNPLDQWLIANLVTVITEADHHLANYEHANALEAIEGFFWTFCDDYIELAKSRAYRGDLSARHTLTWALTIILKLFAPFLPFVTSEVNAWIDPDSDLANQAYPDSSLYTDIATLEFNLFEEVTEILGKLRSIRSLAKRSFKVPLASVKLALSPTLLIAAHAVQADLLTALNCQSLSFQVDSMDSGIEILNYQFAED